MLTIRPEQYDAIASSHRRRVNLELAQYAQARFPEVRDDRVGLEAMDRIRTTANRYDIALEEDVAAFVDFSIMYGEDFHLADWCKDVLLNDNFSGSERIAILKARASLD